MGVSCWFWRRKEVEREDLQSSNTVQIPQDTTALEKRFTKFALRMSAPLGRVRTSSECSEGEVAGAMTIPNKGGVAYDMDGKFSYCQVMKTRLMDMRPVPPGWY